MAWSALLVAHTLAAAFALALGPFNLLRKRKGDAWHRALGYAWIVAMYWVVLSSFWIRELRPGRFSWIHLLSLLTFATLTLGMVAIRRGDVRGHRGHMIGSYLGLVGAFVGAVAVPARDIPRFAVEEPFRFAAVTAAVVLAAFVVAVGLRTMPAPLPPRPRRPGRPR